MMKEEFGCLIKVNDYKRERKYFGFGIVNTNYIKYISLLSLIDHIFWCQFLYFVHFCINTIVKLMFLFLLTIFIYLGSKDAVTTCNFLHHLLEPLSNFLSNVMDIWGYTHGLWFWRRKQYQLLQYILLHHLFHLSLAVLLTHYYQPVHLLFF